MYKKEATLKKLYFDHVDNKMFIWITVIYQANSNS